KFNRCVRENEYLWRTLAEAIFRSNCAIYWFPDLRPLCSLLKMPPLTYASYLDLEKLLSLQKPRSSPPEHDETLFIIIHQTYELWFKQLLHEFEKIKRDFSVGDLFGAIHTFKRVRTIMKVLVAQIDILETMTP